MAAPPLAYFAALGLGALVRVLDSSRSSISTTIFRAGLVALVLLPIGTAFSRPTSWSITTDFTALGFDRNRGVWGTALGLARLLFILIVVLAIAPRLRPRRTPVWVGIPLFVAIAALAIRPAGDAHQYFRFYLAVDRRSGFNDELGKLREAVDRYSSLLDRILVSPGGTYREPHMIYYYYALRNGFPFRDSLSAPPIDNARARSARLYLQVDHVEKVNHVQIPGRLLAASAWWRLSCIAADGCSGLAP